MTTRPQHLRVVTPDASRQAYERSRPEPMPIPEGHWLNVGSGPVDADGWTHLDGSLQTKLSRHRWLSFVARVVLKKEVGHWPAVIKYCDVRQGLGFDRESVAVVYSSHMMEHLHRDEALRFLRDAHRVLKPGGVARIVVPDVNSIVRWYLDHQQEPASTRQTASSDLLMDMLMLRPREAPARRGWLSGLLGLGELHEHKWMYDEEGLRALVAEAGFPDVQRKGYLESVVPASRLSGVEFEARISNGGGICVEARK